MYPCENCENVKNNAECEVSFCNCYGRTTCDTCEYKLMCMTQKYSGRSGFGLADYKIYQVLKDLDIEIKDLDIEIE